MSRTGMGGSGLVGIGLSLKPCGCGEVKLSERGMGMRPIDGPQERSVDRAPPA
ncbi:hypothetical protein [Alterinioella nitratireducens]|uniref:hypothetical protein n=1 Tax=Alterinioella nitratireducens TaxID=2735915 RepID=UPI001553DAE3|nr:hypothetical protein [Alterinioella nitratireducens]NPD19051.1 hypothetical protein [Alterinioella nitratireducens]